MPLTLPSILLLNVFGQIATFWEITKIKVVISQDVRICANISIALNVALANTLRKINTFCHLTSFVYSIFLRLHTDYT